MWVTVLASVTFVFVSLVLYADFRWVLVTYLEAGPGARLVIFSLLVTLGLAAIWRWTS